MRPSLLLGATALLLTSCFNEKNPDKSPPDGATDGLGGLLGGGGRGRSPAVSAVPRPP